jgi:hypothetical protein
LSIIFLTPQKRLAQKYRIKVGAPALVLVKAGGVEISRPSKDMLDDVEGFPWIPRPLEQVSVSSIYPDLRSRLHIGFQILADVPLEKCGRCEDVEAPITYADLPDDCVRAFYFAAHWV